VDDIAPADALHAYSVRSPCRALGITDASIVTADAAEAERCCTCPDPIKDLKLAGIGYLYGRDGVARTAMAAKAAKPFAPHACQDRVRFVGEPVRW